MAKILYDTYSVSIKGKSKRDIIKKITQEMPEYVLLSKQHMTLSNIPGISYTDLVIDNISAPSFIYCSKVDEKHYYLLIYIEDVIVFSGLTLLTDVRSKLLLYQSSLVPGVKYYTYGVDSVDVFDSEVTTLEHDLANSIDGKHYQLESAKAVKLKLTKQYKLIIKIVAVVIIIFLLFFLYQKYQAYRAELKAKQAVKQQVSIWQGYYGAMKGPYPDAQVKTVFSQFRAIDLLPDIAMSKFEYKGKTLKITLRNFGYSALNIQDWAKRNEYTITKHTSTLIDLQKSVVVKNAPESDTIMSATRVKAWLIDQVRKHPNTLTLAIKTNSTNKANYQTIDCDLSFKSMPIPLVNSFMQTLHPYPIRLSTISGSTTLGAFTGKIKLQIIGG